MGWGEPVGRVHVVPAGSVTEVPAALGGPPPPPPDRPDSGYSETRERYGASEGLGLTHPNRRMWPRWQWCVVVLDPGMPPFKTAQLRSRPAAIRCALKARGGRRAGGDIPADRRIEVWGRDRWERLKPKGIASSIVPVRPT